MDNKTSFSLPTLSDLLKNIHSNHKNEVLRIIMSLTSKKVLGFTAIATFVSFFVLYDHFNRQV